MRCAHAFETVCVHANGDLVCSIIDGRGDFVLGNVHVASLADIFGGERYAELRRLVLSTSDSYCRAIAKDCPLKSIPVVGGDEVPSPQIRFLQLEPTTACDQLQRAIAMAARIGVPIWFDFARSTWGRSARRPDDLTYLVPYLKPETGLPTWN